MNSYVQVMRNYAVFTGRARRREYWGFFGWNLLVGVVIGIVAGFSRADADAVGVFANLYQLAVLVPSSAVGVRRMHDTGHSGWWLICPVVNLVFALQAGDQGDNEYGPDPSAITSDAEVGAVLSTVAR